MLFLLTALENYIAECVPPDVIRMSNLQIYMDLQRWDGNAYQLRKLTLIDTLSFTQTINPKPLGGIRTVNSSK